MRHALAVLRRNAVLLRDAFERDCGIAFAVATAFLTFVSCDDLGIAALWGKLALVAAVALVALLAAVAEVLLRKERVVWRCGEGELDARYGDLFDLAKRARGICVIPVNTAFDTVVEDVGEAPDGKPLVSPRTIHGQWVGHVLSALGEDGSDSALASLDEAIAAGLASEGAVPVRVAGTGRGKHERYAVGTVAPVAVGGATYLLVALSEFDENNNAHSSGGDLLACLAAVLTWHGTKGQGAGLFLPVMGTGSSSMGLDRQESLERTLAFFRAHAGEVRGRVTVVVYEGDREQASIWGRGDRWFS